MLQALILLTEKLADVFDRLNIPYAFGGALANNAWGIVRATQDADCLVSVPALQYQQLADEFNAMGCVIRHGGGDVPVTVELLRGQIDARKMMDVYWQDLRAELFIPIVPLQDEILRRAVSVRLENRDVKLTTAEDLIVLKMVFQRSKDITDIRGILHARQGELDFDYISTWADKTLADDARVQLDELIAEYAEDGQPDQTDE